MASINRQHNLSWQGAEKAVKAAIAKAENEGWNICAVAVDRGGHVLAMIRMDKTPFHSVQVATDKAYTAASFGFPTRLWQERLAGKNHLSMGLGQQDRFLLIGGGEPIIVEGEVVGAIGVSGATEMDDSLCAQAGVTLLATES